MKLILTLIILGSVGYSYWWTSEKHPEIIQKVEKWIDFRSFDAIEARFSAEQIMDQHRSDLVKESSSKYLEPEVKFYPYLLLEIKYTALSSKKTKEALILWDLFDGEMVLNANQWEKTHGISDFIRCNVQKNEFKMIELLRKKGGTLDKLTLAKELNLDDALLKNLASLCSKKNLIVISGENLRLHLANPKLPDLPESKIEGRLVTKTCKMASRIPNEFSSRQVEKISRIIFEKDFSIRTSSLIFLPVYAITVKKLDGSTSTTHWNGFNGKKFLKSAFHD